MNEENEEKKEMGAKELSKGTMLFASFWVGIFTVLKSLGVINIEMTDIIMSALAIVGVWMPTYLSTWLDKIREIKFGVKGE